MDHFSSSIRRFLPFGSKFEMKNGEELIIKMSELNHSYSDSIKSMLLNTSLDKDATSNRTSTLARNNSHAEDNKAFEISQQSLTDQLNHVDFKKFVEDLKFIDANEEAVLEGYANNTKQSVTVERRNNKNIIIFDNNANDAGAVNTVKLKISVPKVAHRGKDDISTSEPKNTNKTQNLHKDKQEKSSYIVSSKLTSRPISIEEDKQDTDSNFTILQSNNDVLSQCIDKYTGTGLTEKHNGPSTINTQEEIIKRFPELQGQSINSFSISAYEEEIEICPEIQTDAQNTYSCSKLGAEVEKIQTYPKDLVEIHSASKISLQEMHKNGSVIGIDENIHTHTNICMQEPNINNSTKLSAELGKIQTYSNISAQEHKIHSSSIISLQEMKKRNIVGVEEIDIKGRFNIGIQQKKAPGNNILQADKIKRYHASMADAKKIKSSSDLCNQEDKIKGCHNVGIWDENIKSFPDISEQKINNCFSNIGIQEVKIKRCLNINLQGESSSNHGNNSQENEQTSNSSLQDDERRRKNCRNINLSDGEHRNCHNISLPDEISINDRNIGLQKGESNKCQKISTQPEENSLHENELNHIDLQKEQSRNNRKIDLQEKIKKCSDYIRQQQELIQNCKNTPKNSNSATSNQDGVQIRFKSGNLKPIFAQVSDEEFKKLVKSRCEDSKSAIYKPLMGTSALFAKAKPPGNSHNKSDSEIVQDLVNQRFANFLSDYYKRSFNRQNSRVSKNTFDQSTNETDVQKYHDGIIDGLAKSYGMLSEKQKRNKAIEDALARTYKLLARTHKRIPEEVLSREPSFMASTNNGNTSEQYSPKNVVINSSVNNDYMQHRNYEAISNSKRTNNSLEDTFPVNHDLLCSTKRSNSIEVNVSRTCDILSSTASSNEITEAAFLRNCNRLADFNESNSDSSSTKTTCTATLCIDDMDDVKCCTPSVGDYSLEQQTFTKPTCMSEMNLDFLLSTDDNNIDTSVEAHQSSSNYLGSEDSEIVAYNTPGLLKQTLEEALKNNISTDSRISVVNGSTESIGTSNISDLLSKASTYSAMKHALEKPHRRSSTIYEEDSYISDTDQYITNKLSNLITECNVQHQIMLQTAKALNLCKRTKEFMSSVEEIEAERILLLATLKREALKEEIHKIEYEDVNDGGAFGSGCVSINGLTFPPKPRNFLSPNVYDKRRKEFLHWFVGVIKSDLCIYATRAVLADEQGTVKFTEQFVFENLPPDFQIHFSVYAIKIRNNMRNYSHESKYHLNKNENKMCPSPQKLFNLSRDSKHSKPSEGTSVFSSFALEGKCSLGINNLREVGYFKLSEVPLSSSLEGSVVIDFSTSVSMSRDYMNFLNVGANNGEVIVWNRRWCILKGPLLLYFNYPEEDEPLGSLDLRYCLSSYIESAPRSVCPRPRTLLLETAPVDTHHEAANKPTTVIKHFLAADTMRSMMMWEVKLNNTLAALRNWNCMKCNFEFAKDEV